MLIYWNQNNITRGKIWHKFLCPVSYSLHPKQEPSVLHFFCSYWKILSSVLNFYLLCEVNEKHFRWISFMKSMKNDFIESWRFNWRTHHDHFTKLFLNQCKLRKLKQIKVVDIRKTASEECQQGKRRWKFIFCELKTLEFNWFFWYSFFLKKI